MVAQGTLVAGKPSVESSQISQHESRKPEEFIYARIMWKRKWRYKFELCRALPSKPVLLPLSRVSLPDTIVRQSTGPVLSSRVAKCGGDAVHRPLTEYRSAK